MVGRKLSGLAAAGILAVAALTASTGATAAGKVVVQTWGGTWGKHMREAWFDPFEKATGITVEMRPQGSMMAALAKLKAQKSNMGIDVWVTGMAPTLLADEAGLVHPIPKDKLKNAGDLAPGLLGKNYVGVWTIFYGLVYDKTRVPFQITKWTDLADPRLKGKISVPHGIGYGGKFIVLLAWLNGGSETNIDPAFKMLEKIKPNVAVISKSDPEAIKFLTSGETAVATMMPLGNYFKVRQAGDKYVFVAPDPYVPANFNNFALMKGPNTENAIKFIDFAISKEAQENFAARVGVVPANAKAKVPEKLKAYTPDRSKFKFADDAEITKHLAKWADRWNKAIQ